MTKYIYISLGLIISINLFKLLLIFIASLFYKENFRDNIALDLKTILFESIILVFLLATSSWVIDDYLQSKYLIIYFSVLFIALFPGYNFILSPLKYMFNRNIYRKNTELEKVIKKQGFDYNIITIQGKVVNAYATGVLPFSKTILIGEELQKNMSEENLISIIYHEIGHLKLNHLFKLYLINTFLTILSFLFFYLRTYYLGNVAIGIFEPLSILFLGLFVGAFYLYLPGKVQYNLELQADSFASKKVSPEKYAQALVELDILSDGDVSKGGITHPNLTTRIKNIYKK